MRDNRKEEKLSFRPQTVQTVLPYSKTQNKRKKGVISLKFYVSEEGSDKRCFSRVPLDDICKNCCYVC